MRTTKPTRATIVLSCGILTLGLGACTSEPAAGVRFSASEPGNATEPESDAEIPARLVEVLRRDNIRIEDSSMQDGLSAGEVLARFTEEYDESSYQADPKAYSVVVVSSQETRLTAGSKAWIVHVPNVIQHVEGPYDPGDSSEAADEIVVTDMFAFFDPQSGAHLATVYIGPPK